MLLKSSWTMLKIDSFTKRESEFSILYNGTVQFKSAYEKDSWMETPLDKYSWGIYSDNFILTG